MKISIAAALIAFSSVAFSQADSIEVKQDFLSSHAGFGAFEVSVQKSLLDKSLSESLKDHVIKSSEPYYISNMSEIERLIDKEKSSLYPSMNLSLNTFEGSEPLKVSIKSIDTLQERNILRGEVNGLKGSQVKLVVHEGQMTGRITFIDSQKVLVIRSINGGITANYEVDTSEIRYD